MGCEMDGDQFCAPFMPVKSMRSEESVGPRCGGFELQRFQRFEGGGQYNGTEVDRTTGGRPEFPESYTPFFKVANDLTEKRLALRHPRARIVELFRLEHPIGADDAF